VEASPQQVDVCLPCMENKELIEKTKAALSGISNSFMFTLKSASKAIADSSSFFPF